MLTGLERICWSFTAAPGCLDKKFSPYVLIKGRRSLANASVLSTNRGAYTCRCPSLGLARETVARGHARVETPYISAFVTYLRMRKAIFSISGLLSFALCRLHY